jgi:multisubunit Na+/H+ antiporter MnhG subunit
LAIFSVCLLILTIVFSFLHKERDRMKAVLIALIVLMLNLGLTH